jgi:hypothetical protein
MSIPKQYATDNIERLFVAYAYSYLDEAIEALKEKPNAEAVAIQPHEAKKRFTAAEEALSLYMHLKDGRGIPILFTPQARMAQRGQFFTCGARLLDVLDATEVGVRELIERNMESGRWVLQAGDVLYAEKNVLIVQSPILALSEISSFESLPVGAAFNILGRNRGKPVKAVAIPAPKFIQIGYEHILQAL